MSSSRIVGERICRAAVDGGAEIKRNAHGGAGGVYYGNTPEVGGWLVVGNKKNKSPN